MPRMLFRLSALTLASAALISASPVEQAPPVPPAAEDPNVLGYGRDGLNRMTVPVSIGGKGPYRFVVDTGSERTVISKELARRLNLGAGAKAIVHSMTEVSETQTVIIPTLELSRNTVKSIHAPALAQVHLGAEGMLGVDSLQKQRVLFDFKKQEMVISPSKSRERRWASSDTIVVTARSRFGHLVLVDASVEGEKVWAILDTGSEVTIGNEALRRKLERKRKLNATVPLELISVTGGRTMADYTKADILKLGGAEIRDMPIGFAEVHPFRKLKLTDRPAILIGMDALKLFDRVSVDFATREVRLLLPDQSSLDPRTRFAVR